jgi:general secretion pathway protein G
MTAAARPPRPSPRAPRAGRRIDGRRGRVAAGFTLIELVVTLALIGLIAMLALPVAELAFTRHKEAELRIALRDIRTAIDAYKRAADSGLIAKGLTDSGYPPNLKVLADGEVNTRDPKGGRIVFIRRLPRNPFETDADLPAEKTWGLRAYGTPVDAPAEGADVFDVYTRSSRPGINGIVYAKW